MKKGFVSSGAVAIAMALFVVCNLGGTNVKAKTNLSNNDIFYSGSDVSYCSTYVKQDRSSNDRSGTFDNSCDRRSSLASKEYKESKRVELDTDTQIEEEIRLGEMEMLALLVHAEAGNQDLKGKRLVADVVLNRVEAGIGENVEEVIFMDDQFSVIKDGAYDNAGWEITEEDFEAARIEYESSKRLDENVLYFTAGGYNPYCIPAYKYGDHYFGY